MICEKGYQTIQGNECLNACIGSYLNYTGSKINGNAIFWAGGGFHLFEVPEGEYGLLTDVQGAQRCFLDKHKIPYVIDDFRDQPDIAKEFLKEAIYSEKMIILETTANNLTYSTAFSGTDEGKHYINVIGISEDESQLYISDGLVPQVCPTTFEGWLSFDTIFKAWENSDFVYNIFQGVENIKYDEVMDEAVSQFYLSLSIYLDKETALREKLGFGEEIVYNMFNCLFCEEKPFSDKTIMIKQMNYKMKAYGFIFSKYFIVDQLIVMKYDQKIIEEYRNIIVRWNNLCFYMLKISIAKRWKDLDKLRDIAYTLIKEERKILSLILMQK